MKKIFAVLCVKNECDIIESFCRYTAIFCDRIIIYDDGSNDNTVNIIDSLKHEGYKIDLIEGGEDARRDAFRQEVIMNMLIETAFNTGADLVLPLDADEFLFIDNEGNPDLRNYLENLDESIEHRVSWRTLIYTGHEEFSDNTMFLPEYFPTCSLPSSNYFGSASKTLAISRKLFIDDKLRICRGNHCLLRNGIQNSPFVWLQDINSIHIPIRSVHQFSAKVINRRAMLYTLPRQKLAKMNESLNEQGLLTKQYLRDYCVIKYAEYGYKGEGAALYIKQSFFNKLNIKLKYTDYSLIEKNYLHNVIHSYERAILYMRKLVPDDSFYYK